MRIGVDITYSPWRIVALDSNDEIVGSFSFDRSENKPTGDLDEFRRLIAFAGRRPLTTVGIGGSGVHLKHIVVPYSNDPEDIVQNHTGEIISGASMETEDALIDCSIVDNVQQEEVRKTRVLAVAASREPVMSAVEFLFDAGLDVAAVEPFAFSQLRYSQKTEKPSAGRFWIRLTPEFLAVSAMHDDKIVFWREIFQNFGSLAESGVTGEMAREGIVSEIAQSLDFFAAKHHQVEVEEIHFLPETPGAEQLRGALGDAAGTEVRIENPFERFNTAPEGIPDAALTERPGFAVPYGLALRGKATP